MPDSIRHPEIYMTVMTLDPGSKKPVPDIDPGSGMTILPTALFWQLRLSLRGLCFKGGLNIEIPTGTTNQKPIF